MQRRFTLVEMLVVLVIILVMIGIALGSYSMISKKVKIVKAKARITQMLVAISAYKERYGGVYPFTAQTGTGDNLVITDTSTPSFADLLDTLNGQNPARNPRKEKFLELDAENTFNDSWAEGGASGWTVVLDLDYDGLIMDTQVAGASVLNKDVVIWSRGPDQQDSAADDTDPTNSDNVVSWR